MGDPAGVGPEILLKALSRDELFEARFVVLGYLPYLERAARVCQIDFASILNRVDFIQPGASISENIEPGKVSAEGGRAAVQAILGAVQLTRTGDVDGIVTGPINKASLHEAGYAWPGHTEMLAQLTGTEHVIMMLAAERFRVALVTTHMRLLDAVRSITADGVVGCAEITARGLRRHFTDGPPRLALAALNPHAGEGGLFGPEEEQILRPAVRTLRQQGIAIEGPLSADSLFARAAEGAYDAVISLYHDQGLIPLKMAARGRAVNVTLGLPIIRTSVGHGTAFDIAGAGRANEQSLVDAIRTAVYMARHKGSAHADQA